MSDITEQDMQRLNHVVTSIVEYVTVKGFKALVDPLTEIDVFRKIRIFKIHQGQQVYMDANISISDIKRCGEEKYKLMCDYVMKEINDMIAQDRRLIAGYGVITPVSLLFDEPIEHAKPELSARDTQFASSASNLIERLLAVEGVYIDATHEHWREEWEEIAAHYAYNVARHSVAYSIDYMLTNGIDMSGGNGERICSDIPDLTEWPEQETEQ